MATVVASHAHPDDEVVLTGGTLARAAATGHRVVVVTATDGRMRNEDDGSRLQLPPQVFGLLFAREWFVDPALPAGTIRRDIFD